MESTTSSDVDTETSSRCAGPLTHIARLKKSAVIPNSAVANAREQDLEQASHRWVDYRVSWNGPLDLRIFRDRSSVDH